ncbi:MAG: hypothetical protein WC558_16825, partial [Patulibacter sp.]
MRRSPSPAAVLTCLVLVPAALLGASPAAAAPGDSRATQLTRELQRDPVYVSPSLSRVITPEQVAALRRQVDEMPFPTFVAIVPRFTDEPGSRVTGDLSTILRDRIGRDGLYVVADGSYGLEARAFGVRTQGEIRRIGSTASDAVPRRDGPVARVRFALDHLATGATAEYSVDEERAREDRGPWLAMAGGGVLGFVVPLGIVAALPSSRRRRAERRELRAAGRIGDASRHDPTVSEPPAADALRAAQDRLGRLGRAIESASAPPEEALRAYEAASHVLTWDD